MLFSYNDDITVLRRIRRSHFLITVIFPIAGLAIIYLTTKSKDGPAGWSLDRLEVYFIILSLIMMTVGLLLPRIAKWDKKTNRNILDVWAGFLYRGTLLSGGVGFGVIMSLTGSGLYISLPLTLLSTILYIITFPTDRRLAQWYSGERSDD